MDDCKRYEGITPEKLQLLKQGLQKNGIKPPEGDSGTVVAMGVKLSVTYIAAEQALNICILEKPPFIPAALVWGQIDGAAQALKPGG